MANKTAVLAIRIISDTKGGVKGLDQTATAADKATARLKKVGPAALIVSAALVKLGADAARSASEAEQAAGAVDAIFGAHAAGVKAIAAQAADNVGLAASQYNSLASVIGAQLKNMGTAQDQLAPKTEELVSLGADLAATFGGTTADAVAALSSLLRGERDPIERYGVSIKQATIDSKKLELGLDGLTGEAALQADAQATLALLTEQTADAAGQFARETDSASGSAQIAAANWENASAKLGEQLLPYLVEGAKVLSAFATWVSDNSELATALALTIGGLTVAVWAFNVALTANPIGLVVAAVALAIGLIVVVTLLLIDNWEKVEATAEEVFGNIVEWMRGVLEWADRVANSVGDWFSDPFGLNASLESTSTQRVLHEGQGPMFLEAASSPFAGFSDAAFSAPAAFPSRAASQPPVVQNTFNISGAIDSMGTARAIKKVLTTSGKVTGAIPAAGASL